MIQFDEYFSDKLKPLTRRNWMYKRQCLPKSCKFTIVCVFFSIVEWKTIETLMKSKLDNRGIKWEGIYSHLHADILWYTYMILYTRTLNHKQQWNVSKNRGFYFPQACGKGSMRFFFLLIYSLVFISRATSLAHKCWCFTLFIIIIVTTWWFKVIFLGWLSDPFKGLSDLQPGDEKGTLNHLAYNFSFFWAMNI